MRNVINPGDAVRTKRFGRCTVLRADTRTITVETDAPNGGTCCAREDVSLCRDQTPVPLRQRFWMPYVLWTCADGTEVLGNRNYRPILIRHPGRSAIIAGGNEDVPFVAEVKLFEDPPWVCNKTQKRLQALLIDWGFGEWQGEGLGANHKKNSDQDLVVPAWAEAMSRLPDTKLAA